MKALSHKTSLLVILLVVLSNNVFCQDNATDDDRIKVRLGFTSINNLHRQILVTVDSNATSGIDFGYDAEYFENHIDDMYWMIDDRKFLIQGTDLIEATTVLPIGLHTNAPGENIISIEDLINFPEDLEIGILDKETNTYHDLKQTSSVSIYLEAGEYLNRFELVFENNTEDDSTDNEEEEEEEEDNNDENTDNDDNNDATDNSSNEVEVEIAENDVETEDTPIELNYINRIKSISIKNIGNQTIKSVRVYSITGQQITEYNNINAVDQALLKAYNLNAGNYILLVTTDLGRVTKKILVR